MYPRVDIRAALKDEAKRARLVAMFERGVKSIPRDNLRPVSR